ncbi:MAG: NeuD/PglB/VioB family sugar acetyltransferase [Chloroflexota bacterium]
MSGSRIVIIGAGDHGRVLAELARTAGWSVAGFVEPVGAAEDATRTVAGLAILGSLDLPDAWYATGTAFATALGDNRKRAVAFARGLELDMRPAALVHPTAALLGGAVVEDGGQVCAGAIVGVDARVGADAILNTAATLDHDGRLEAHAHVGPGAHLAGRVTVEQGAFVGTGATIIPGRRIGAWAVVAAGAVVIDDVEPEGRVGGVPARPLTSG